ncbi:hypothetical protein ID866_5750 [Astraeus odoratus]|nr:hypothetical protein ID866_5750 [Astraeus odoratus]
MAFRRKESGFLVALDLIEYARDLNMLESIYDNESLKKLRDYVCDIAVLCEDIVSCAKGTRSLDHSNLIMVFRKVEKLSLEDALTRAGTVVKERVDAFLDVEHTFLQSLEDGHESINDVQSYVQGLRDWVSGFVNWLYETERYLGKKGSEVRAFGWVFLPDAASPS